jgi:poly [ADP-ribose] polymerase
MAPRRSARVRKKAVPAKKALVDRAPVKKAPVKKRAAAAAASRASPTKKKRLTGLKTAVTDTNAPLGVIDPELNLGATATIELLDGEPCDVMLALVDPAKHMDKFFILQLIQKTSVQWLVYTRWGRTGTSGQALEQEFDSLVSAVACFETKFKEKTGLDWDDRQESVQGNKYRFIIQDFLRKHYGFSGAKWQYWVDDGIDGKTTGWYDYDTVASARVERLYTEHTNNPQFNERTVDSGMWTYTVNLTQMIQTNIKHENHTSRRIRRCADSVVQDNDPPATISSAVMMPSTPLSAPSVAMSTPLSAPRAVISTPLSAPSAVMCTSLFTPSAVMSTSATVPSALMSTPLSTPSAVMPTPLSAPNAVMSTPLSTPSAVMSTPDVVPSAVASSATLVTPSPALQKASSIHPVDQDVAVQGKDPSDYRVVKGEDDQWYDVVLNQCNIGTNNNKYYRLQILEDKSNSGNYYVWFRWGRVGEPAKMSASTWLGFSSVDQARKEFAKKYRDKTGNAFGADTFAEKKGKYKLVQVDNDVAIKEEHHDSTSAPVQEEIEYMPSALDGKTKELIEVLFSKEMRNQALTSFNLDLKRLPLGVPSQQQIQHGISILSEIEDKLGGGSAADTLEELSSRFYTAIPHSFGRSRPPIISNQEALQGRYDMCNILNDMYSTNETIRKIEDCQNKKRIVPCPTDSYYLSLNADLTLVDNASANYKVIHEYFAETKAAGSGAQLLNIWSADRNGESNRFTKFDKVENRCLLWHGTNIAVVAPIITSGLRIMPHSGGRVGAGIYLAGLQEKSAQYTSSYGAKFACMFLCEAPLGRQHVVDQDGHHASSLKTAPPGFDSVHAVGVMQHHQWTTINIDDKDVKVPQGKAGRTSTASSFHHDEFLVYDESQVRLRYILSVKL